MEIVNKVRQYILTGVLPYMLTLPAILIFSILVPFHNPSGCYHDEFPPVCILQEVIIDGEEMLNGRLVEFEAPGRDDCSEDLDIRYFLDAGNVPLESPIVLPYGSHWIQSHITDEAGNMSVCEFQVHIKSPVTRGNGEPGVFGALSSQGESTKDVRKEDGINFELGGLSVFWESGRLGPGVISDGSGDPGGPSYGLYQISLKKGYFDDFLENEGRSFRSMLGVHQPGSGEFNMVWNEISDLFPLDFRRAQHEYIHRSHYEKYAKRVKYQLGLDIEQYSDVMKDVLWSTAVQHGPYNDVFYHALNKMDLSSASEEEIIRSIYAERARIENDKLAYFPRVGPRWTKNLLKRFSSEQKMALLRIGIYDSGNPQDYVIDLSPSETEMQVQTTVQESDAENRSTKTSAHVQKSSRAIENRNSESLAMEAPGHLVKNTGNTQFPGGPTSSIINDSQESKITDIKSNLETYRVLFVVLKENNSSFPKLEGLGDIYEDPFRGGQVRYLIGQEPSLEQAEQLLEKVKMRGYQAALITRFNGNKLVDFID